MSKTLTQKLVKELGKIFNIMEKKQYYYLDLKLSKINYLKMKVSMILLRMIINYMNMKEKNLTHILMGMNLISQI